MCKLGLHISSAAGTSWVCMCTMVGGILARGCVCVFVCLHRLRVRMYLWVCIPLPLVFLTSKTLTSSERGSYHPQPVIIQKYFKSLLKREYCALITAAAGSNIIAYRVWKSQQHRHLQPPLLIFYVWNSSRPRLLSYLSISSPVFLSGLIRASEKRAAPRSRAVCSDPALVLEPTRIQTEAFKNSPAVATQQEAQWVCVTSSVSAISTWMRFHYLVKGKRTGISKPNKEDIFCICLLCRILSSIWCVIRCGSFVLRHLSVAFALAYEL